MKLFRLQLIYWETIKSQLTNLCLKVCRMIASRCPLPVCLHHQICKLKD